MDLLLVFRGLVGVDLWGSMVDGEVVRMVLQVVVLLVWKSLLGNPVVVHLVWKSLLENREEVRPV